MALLHQNQVIEQAVIGAYWPIAGEVDCRPLFETLAPLFGLALPVAMAADKPLLFREWQPDQPLIKGRYDIPVPDDAAAVVTPNILLIPMVGFDRQGYRLGMGGGFYDRTLPGLKALTIGLSYQASQVDDLPHEPHDQPLDWIVTEDGAMSFAR